MRTCLKDTKVFVKRIHRYSRSNGLIPCLTISSLVLDRKVTWLVVSSNNQVLRHPTVKPDSNRPVKKTSRGNPVYQPDSFRTECVDPPLSDRRSHTRGKEAIHRNQTRVNVPLGYLDLVVLSRSESHVRDKFRDEHDTNDYRVTSFVRCISVGFTSPLFIKKFHSYRHKHLLYWQM